MPGCCRGIGVQSGGRGKICHSDIYKVKQGVEDVIYDRSIIRDCQTQRR